MVDCRAMSILILPVLAWLLAVVILLFVHRRTLRALWREPMLRHPVLIVESDDWGAGPQEQAPALSAIVALLARHRDITGRPPVMTVALILALPELHQAEHLRRLDAPEFAPILDALRAGIAQGMLAPQLHGMTHFWPPALARAGATQAEVTAWLAAPELTEQLPSPLQSRWTDAAELPSKALDADAIRAAATAEVATYAAILGSPARVVVPPTFVWNATVEAAWATAGIDIVITPGRRLTGRDAAGAPSGIDKWMRNAEPASGQAIYLVRDDYFEPKRGHRPEQAVTALARKYALGRPCLLETHRDNFLACAGGDRTASLAALDALYTQAQAAFPELRYLSSAELGYALRDGDAHWIETCPRRRRAIYLRRCAEIPRFARLARYLGLFALAARLRVFPQH